MEECVLLGIGECLAKLGENVILQLERIVVEQFLGHLDGNMELVRVQKDLGKGGVTERECAAFLNPRSGRRSRCNVDFMLTGCGDGHNFAVLRQQYQSDIRRIGFIVEGAAHTSPAPRKIRCPICGEETERVQDTAFIDTSAAELEKIKRHLSELGDAQRSVAHQQESIITTIRALEEKRDAIDALISSQLQPRLAAFEKELEQQLKLIQISSELEVVRQDEIQYRGDLFSKETEEISDSGLRWESWTKTGPGGGPHVQHGAKADRHRDLHQIRS